MKLDALPSIYPTHRLHLRPFAPADRAHYAAYHALPDVYRYLYAAPPQEGMPLDRQFDAVLDAAFTEDGDIFRLAVTDKNEALVGEVLLKMANKASLQGEVGYIFNPAFSGRGYATEAVAAMIDIGFNTIGFHRIFARLDTANKGSVGVVERLGMRREAHLVQNDRFNEAWGDEYIYAVLKAEWVARNPLGH